NSPQYSDLSVDEILADFEIPGTDGSFVGDFISTQQTTQLNGLGSLGLEIGDNHKISSTNLILRSTLKDTRNQTSALASDNTIEQFQENFEFIERQVWQTQLTGEHVFPELADLEVNWRGAYGKALRDAPFQFQTRRGVLGETALFPFGVFGTAITSPITVEFSEVKDTNIDAGVDFLLPFNLGDLPIDVKFGYAYTDKERDSFVRTFEFDVSGDPLANILATSRNDVLFSESVLGSDLFGISSGAPISNIITLDNALSTLQVHAAYGGVDLPIGEYVRLAAGARFESGEQVTDAFSSAQPDVTRSITTIEEEYFLPAATVTWNPIGDLQVRAAFSQTITRPQFRELTPALFRDDDTDQQILGNPFLVNAEVDNFDIRAEYYFSRGQFVTLGAFYKDIENPIEATSVTGPGGEVFISYLNAPAAEVYGVEFEFEKNFYLDEIFDSRWFEGKELVFKTNYTFSQSEVSADGDVITASVNSQIGAFPDIDPASSELVDGRSLQGQSDHLVNLQIGIENPETNGRATVLLNWSSERIRQTEQVVSGVIGPAVVEKPPLLVDFVWSRDLEDFLGTGDGTKIGLEVRNILGEDYEATQSFSDGSEATFDSYNIGRTFTFNIKRSF
ncbi:MAG: TonB-dependent receptor, partial [Pseudomonadota bacterium]